MSYILKPSQTHYLNVADLQILFDLRRGRARLMMGVLRLVRIGSKDHVLNTKLEAYLKDYGGIHVNWKKRHEYSTVMFMRHSRFYELAAPLCNRH